MSSLLIMTTGTWSRWCRSRSAARRPKPSSPGRLTSSRTRSTRSVARCSRAASAEAAHLTAWPSRPSQRSHIFRKTAESSTQRIRVGGAPSSVVSDPRGRAASIGQGGGGWTTAERDYVTPQRILLPRARLADESLQAVLFGLFALPGSECFLFDAVNWQWVWCGSPLFHCAAAAAAYASAQSPPSTPPTWATHAARSAPASPPPPPDRSHAPAVA